MTDDRPRAPRVGTTLTALAADTVLIVGFAATGRASHDENVLSGLGTTAWPFLAALALGWIAVLGWRAPVAPWRTGLPVWAVVLVGGMLLRAASGQGTQTAFVIVAALVLAATLIGWRVVATLVIRRRGRRSQG